MKSFRFGMFGSCAVLIAACGLARAQMTVSNTNNNTAAQAAAAAERLKLEKEQRGSIAAANTQIRREQEEDAAHGVAADSRAKYVVHDGDPIELLVLKGLNSKTAQVGDPVPMELAADLKVGDVVVARAGSRAMGEVLWIDKASFGGQRGSIQIRMDCLRVGDRKIYLRGTKTLKEGDGVALAKAAALGMSGPGVLFKGSEMTLPAGMPVDAYLGDDAKLPPDESETKLSVVSTVPATGTTVLVECNVMDADIEVDGKLVGTTPAAVTVPPGQHTIVVKKKGYADWSRTMTQMGASANLKVELEKAGKGGL